MLNPTVSIFNPEDRRNVTCFLITGPSELGWLEIDKSFHKKGDPNDVVDTTLDEDSRGDVRGPWVDRDNVRDFYIPWVWVRRSGCCNELVEHDHSQPFEKCVTFACRTGH